ncbi:hypothetical protein [Comamonas aquatica]|uniref:hypothetical protein n=1 Tax=Comamonas aquatica TaxID=225991 RepID=UPI0031D409F8
MPDTITLITKQRVKDWQACESGYRWFIENYKSEPSAEFVPLYQHLVRDKRGDDADWLMGKLFGEIEDAALRVKLVTQIAGADAKLIAEQHAAGAPGVTEDDEVAAATTGDCSAAATTGNYSAAATTGYRSAAATTGDYSAAATTGDCSAAATTGDYSAAATTGNYSAAATTGDCSAAATTGDYSAAATMGYRSAAATTGDCSAAATTGDYSAAATTGYRSAAATTGDYSAAATTGDYSAAATTGDYSIAAALGIRSKAKASSGGAIVLAYFDADYKLKHVRAAMVGQDGIKPGVWYSLDESGNFTESAED